MMPAHEQHHFGPKPPGFRGFLTEIFMTMENHHYSKAAHYWGVFMTFLILLSCVTFMASTCPMFNYEPDESHCHHFVCVPGDGQGCTRKVCKPHEKKGIHEIEFAVLYIFTFDFLFRVLIVWAVPQRMIYEEKEVKKSKMLTRMAKREPGPIVKTLTYLIQPMSVIDMFAVFPMYLEYVVGENKVFILRENFHILRLMRLLRIYKLGRYSDGLVLLYRALKRSTRALGLLGLFMLLLTVTWGTLIFFAEHGHFTVTPQYPNGEYLRHGPDGLEESPYTSIFVAAYWVILIGTTVGSADIYPVTTIGRIITVFVAYSGIIVVVSPVMIIGKSFSEEYAKMYGETTGVVHPAKLASNRLLREKSSKDVEAGGSYYDDNGGDASAVLALQLSRMEDAFLQVQSLMTDLQKNTKKTQKGVEYVSDLGDLDGVAVFGNSTRDIAPRNRAM